ncbi:amino acid adenylation domain-containing protein [Kibdelosporangium philippinense]|uniref:Phenyloxazoline synthase MbtB n=1 Tax=Kibdelosporangium philippinense TaxID=211113 RepID=A0ABS8Z301_9PSEU|nr:non-ribosomal peptide synthetase [Kibdelosporangium philippinense]MCE7002311.1 amino acid adenylation domain-containing protein [Kibdelosporangium philippinense]
MTISPPIGPAQPDTGHAIAAWRDHLAGAPALLDLPTDRPVRDEPYRPASVPVVVPARTSATLHGAGTQPQDGWLVAFAALLHRFSGQREVVIGSLAADGATAYRLRLTPQSTFTGILHALRDSGIPPIELAEFAALLHPGRSFASTFSAGVVCGTEPRPWEGARLSLLVPEDGGEIRIGYDATLLDESRAHRIAAHLATLAIGIADNPDAEIGGLTFLPAAERHRVLVGFNESTVEYKDQRSFERRIADLAAATPDAQALSYRSERLTYGQLDEAANQLAAHLIAHDVCPGDFVGLFLERSAQAVIATLAALRCGAVVVPFDPADNDDWIAYMIRDSAPAAVISDAGLAGRLRSLHRSTVDTAVLVLLDTDAAAIAACPADHPGIEVPADSTSHIVYTSGSTGTPKGACATHRALVNLINWMPAAYGITADSAGTWVSAPGFAIGRMEWMPFLAAGAQLHIADALTASSPARTRDWLLGKKVTHTLLVTSFARRVCALHWPANAALRLMIVLGEPVRSWPSGPLPFEITVSYGSTEVAVATSSYDEAIGLRATSATAGEGPIAGRPTAGRPVANARIYILDERRQPVPVGAAGEIYVAGDGVCTGYLNRPVDTEQRLVPNPLPEEPGDVLFRTGDLGRWRPDGLLEVIGRHDAQTWVGGVLVEVSQVETVINERRDVREAAVIAYGGEAGGQLVGYVVPADPENWSLEALQASLRQRLPEHQVPAVLIGLPALPKLANGKLDRQALPQPPRERGVPESDEASRFKPFPLTDTQQAYWVGRSDALDLGGVGCHGYWEWESESLDVQRFEIAWQKVLDRHDALRTVILPDGTQQVLADPPAYVIPIHDLSELPAAEADARAAELREEMAHRVLPADTFPLWDVQLTKVPGGRVRVHLGLDLLIIDAWSYFQVLVPDLVAYYEDPDTELPPIGLRFRDYVVTVEGELESTADYQRAKDYWLNRIDDLPPAPQLPRGTGRIPEQVRFTRREHSVSAARWTDLKDRASASSVTPSGIVVAVFAEILRAWSSEDRFTINLPLFNRVAAHPDIDKVIGDFTTTSLLSVDKVDGSFAERAVAVQQQLWADLEHRQFGGVRVMREMATRQGVASHASFPVVVTSLLGQPPRAFYTALGEAIYTSTQTPQVTLDFQVSEVEGELRFSWDSVDEAFPTGLLADMFGAYVDLLDRLIDQPAAWELERFPLVPEYQLESRRAANDTAIERPATLLHTAVAEHASQRPGATAIVSGDVRIDYAEFSRRVNQIGNVLRNNEVRPNQLVAIVMRKGWEQVVAAHGVLAAGGAYLPIDANVPPERLRYLLEHGEVRYILTQSAVLGTHTWPESVSVLCVDTDFEFAEDKALDLVQQPTDLAYVIYTSGSTGKPKGVMVDHQGVANTILDINSRFGIGPDDSCLGVSGLHFDLSVYDVFGMIAAGGTVVLPEPSANPDPERWAELIRDEQITFYNSVPTLLEILTTHAETGEPLDSLRTVVLAGDWIPVTLPSRLRAIAPNVRVVASGGPTETCVWSVINVLGHVDESLPSIPYGKPMSNQRYHILDSALQHRPVWVPGEIHIASEVGLAKGYWRDDERTAAQFFGLPGEEPRVYASGDLGRYLPDGSIEILGRTDFQVKIQGHRIELGEIEAVLADHPDVDRAVVVAVGERHTQRLVGYVTGQASSEQLRAYLAGTLPQYMVPSTIQLLEQLPLTGNGKVDRLALSAETLGSQADTAGGPPEGPVEEAVAAIWSELLNVASVGRGDHFFKVGGNSITATKVVARLRELFGVELPLRVVFTQPTVAQIAEALLADPASADQVLAICALLEDLTDEQLARLTS